MTTAQDQQSRAELSDFEAWYAKQCMRSDDAKQGLIRAWAHLAWKAARALPAAENVREGEPYDAPAFEDLARTMGVWGTAQAALCAQFFLAGRGAVPAGMESLRDVIRRCADFIENAPVSSGVCCCGDSIEHHADPMSCGHSPRDQWDYSAESMVAELRAATAEAQVQAMGRVPPDWQAVPVEPTSKQVVLMAGAILQQAQGTADTRHPYWHQAVEQAEKAYRDALAAAPRPPAAQERAA